MIKLTTKGRAPRLYDCYGEKITVKEAADRLGVSVHTLRNRLQLYGDNMEEVMRFYRDKEEMRSEKAMKKIPLTAEQEQKAVEDLAAMLCGSAESQPAEETSENFLRGGTDVPEPVVETMPVEESEAPAVVEENIDQETPVRENTAEEVVPVPVSPEEDANDEKRSSLRVLNEAIKALSAMSKVPLSDPLDSRIVGLRCDLQAVRRCVFDSLVDWDKVASGGM